MTALAAFCGIGLAGGAALLVAGIRGVAKQVRHQRPGAAPFCRW